MKEIRMLICCVVLCLFFPKTAYAEEIAFEKEPVDIIFVMDCSGSMKVNDPSKIRGIMKESIVEKYLSFS